MQPFADDIWLVDGPTVYAAFMPLPTRMMVVRLDDSSLWINSPVALPDATLDEIVALGPVRYLVAPTALHAWRLGPWHARFPEAQLWIAPPIARGFARGVFAAVAGVARSPAPEGWNRIEDAPPALWARDLDQLVFRGNYFLEEVEFLHKRSRTLMIADFIQNYAAVEGDFVGNLMKRATGILGGGVPRDIQWSFRNRQYAQASLGKLLSWDFDKLIGAHGLCVEHDAKAFVERAFRWLTS